MPNRHRRSLGNCVAIAGICLLFPASALAGWPADPRPSRDLQPVPKGHPVPHYKNVAADPVGDVFGVGAVQLDLGELSAEVVDDELLVTLGFFGSFSAPDSGQADALDGFIDLDLDQDGSTGDVPWTDFLRGDGGQTGMGNEAYVDLFSYDQDGKVEVVDDATESVLGLAQVTLTASAARIAIPLDLLGGDATVDVAAIVGTLAEPTDAAPNQGSVASSDSAAVFLQGDRFRVEVEWGDFEGQVGAGRLGERTPDSAVLYFFAPENWEMLVKVIDACDYNGHFWVFFAATTNVEFTLEVTDTASGLQKEYSNPLGNPADAVTDTTAFATCP